MAQIANNLPAIQEMWGGEDALQNGMATHPNTLAWKIPWTENLAGYHPWDCKDSDTIGHAILPLASPAVSFPVVEPLQIPRQSPCCEIRMKASPKSTPMLRRLWLPPRVLFPLEAQGRLLHVVLCWPRRGQRGAASYPSKVVCPDSPWCGGCFSLTRILSVVSCS